MRKFFGLFTLVFCVINTMTADEGMWLPNMIKQMNYSDMQKLGCKLTADQIYDINNSSMKDAIFQLMKEDPSGDRGFCTGEIISSQGLMLTNHHCGYESIAKSSSVEHDYLTDGFWAKTKQEELPIEGLAVSRVVRIENVTAQIVKNLTPDMDEAKRTTTARQAFKAIETEAVKGTHYVAKIKEMFEGNEYYLFVYEVFRDVRLTGAPPSSIGKYGGDTDNWMWPRHTGDFSMFRIYMSPDGKPAKYSKDNVPYKPLHFLPISLKGISENDYAMIMGYPGTTDRYISSYGMEYKRSTYNPLLVRLFDAKLKAMKEVMNSSDAIRIAYAGKCAQLANTWKNLDGEALNLTKTDAISQRKELEKKFAQWVAADPLRVSEYGKVLPAFDSAYKNTGLSFRQVIYTAQGLLQSSSQISMMSQYMDLLDSLESPKKNPTAVNTIVEKLKAGLDASFKNYYAAMDKTVFATMLKMYIKDLTPAEQNGYFTYVIYKKYKAKTPEQSIDLFVDAIFEKSIFTDRTRLESFLNSPNAKTLKTDLMFDYAMSIMADYRTSIQSKYLAAQKDLALNERLFIKGLREMMPEGKFYPDANSTLRLTYGTVKSYDPFDGAHYKNQTFLDGVIAKMDPRKTDFKYDQKLVDLFNKKDYGIYADKDGKMPVAFLTDNDITGGNSGSPVINGNGELIGAAFDGNWEWLTGNLVFNDKLQRTICVDIRYVLFVVDKYAGAGHLVNEMTIVR